jgi:hypothetical protein
MILENTRNGIGRNIVTKVRQCASKAIVTPGSILPGHPQDKSFDFCGCPGPTGPSKRASVVLISDQFSVPCK